MAFWGRKFLMVVLRKFQAEGVSQLEKLRILLAHHGKAFGMAVGTHLLAGRTHAERHLYPAVVQLPAQVLLYLWSELLHVFLHHFIVDHYLKCRLVFHQVRVHVHHTSGIGALFFGKTGCEFTPVVVQVSFVDDVVFPLFGRLGRFSGLFRRLVLCRRLSGVRMADGYADASCLHDRCLFCCAGLCHEGGAGRRSLGCGNGLCGRLCGGGGTCRGCGLLRLCGGSRLHLAEYGL